MQYRDMNFMEVTPDLAMTWLERNYKDQRNINKPQVERYRKAMEDGEWAPEISPILLSDEMELLDGQHRLWAVVELGEPVMMWVYWGASVDTFPKIDSGISRTLAQALPAGTKNKSCVAGLLRLKVCYENMGVCSSMFRVKIPTYLGVSEYEKDKEAIDKIVADARYVYDSYKRGSAGAIALLFWMVKDLDGYDEFKEGLAGYGPMAWLYRTFNGWLVNNVSLGSGSAGQQAIFTALCFLWNNATDGNPVKILRTGGRKLKLNGVDLNVKDSE